jgi:hypothetical protein
MTLPVYGNSLSLQQIANEFSSGTPHPINSYYSGGAYVPAGTKGYPSGGGAVTIPSSGTITFNNFYGSQNYLPWSGFGSLTSFGSSTTYSQYIAATNSGLFVALGKGSSVVAYSTTNKGATWTSSTISGTTGYYVSGIAVNRSTGRFVALIWNPSTTTSYTSTSTDGVNWSGLTSIPSAGSGSTYTSIAASGTTFIVIVGSGANTYYRTSTDGSTWSAESSIAFVALGVSWCPVNGVFLMVGSAGGGGKAAYSSNASSWSFATINSVAGYNPYYAAENSSGLIVVISNNNISGGTVAYTSSNLTTWNGPYTVETSFYLTGNLICTPGGEFICVSSSQYMTSTNGTSWTTTAFSGITAYMYGVAGDNYGNVLAIGGPSGGGQVYAHN